LDLKICIHRGTREIGGTCVEVESQGARILLDLGLPLDGDPDDVAFHPAIPGLAGGDDLLALILSHGHLDHFGLAHLAGPDLAVALGAATHRILRAAAPFVPRPWLPAKAVEFTSGVPLTFGPFRVTPFLVDHSAYDASALLIEAGGQRVFYSGDLRAHGRKGVLVERLIARPPRDIDILLMEGSSLGRLDRDRTFPTEAEVEATFVEIFRRTEGMALVAASAQNIDRMVSLYRACKRAGRVLVIDLYAAEVLRATANSNIPQSDWPNVAVYVPHYQRVRIKQSGRFDLLEPHKGQRTFSERLKDLAPRAAFLFRPAMLRDLDRADCLAGARAIWSQWDGYLDQGRGKTLLAKFAERGIPVEHAHTSGHASIPDLKRLAAAIGAKVLVPIHTFEAHRFPEHFGPSVSVKRDGEWWEIAA
jgi:ribonuclease J